MVGHNLRVKFEWDPSKAAMDLKNHRVSFDEAMEHRDLYEQANRQV
jgi:uncharacterized DUF497 family protein